MVIYVEGGGGRDMDNRCREGFRGFLARLNLPVQPKIVACGSRSDAFDRFCTHLRQPNHGPCILLVDSETVVSAKSPWEHVRQREGDGWRRPDEASDEHLHFMAVCMEAWIIADADSLADFYDGNFRRNALPTTVDLEQVDKDDLLNSLRSATRDTRKGAYAKGKVSYAALGNTNIIVVAARMSYCCRLVERLRQADSGPAEMQSGVAPRAQRRGRRPPSE